MNETTTTALESPGFNRRSYAQELVDGVPSRLWRQGLANPIRNFRARSGKRIRARLVELAFQAVGGRRYVPAEAGEFIELVHAGSLIVDDIEDGSDFRRGEATLHRQFGTPIALNVGNWMYFSALECLTRLPVSTSTREEVLRVTIQVLRSCHEGQALDLVSRIEDLSRAEVFPTVREITARKTGGLAGLATRLGAMVGSGSPTDCDRLATFGTQLGIGLQMHNDLSELKAATRINGRCDDLRNGRVTWPWAWLSQHASEADFGRLHELANSPLAGTTELAEELYELVHAVGKRSIRHRLQSAKELLREGFGDSALIPLQGILESLEKDHE